MKKVLVFIAVLLMGGYIYFSLNYVDNGHTNYSGLDQEYNQKLKELKVQREELEAELSQYDDDYSIPNMGSVVILLTDIDRKHLTDTISQLDSFGYSGVLALSSSNMPGSDDSTYLSREEVNELIDKGYEIVIKLEDNESPSDVYYSFVEEGYDIKGFYLPNSTNSIEVINSIKNIGDMVIIGSFGDYEDEDILLIEKYGNKYPNVKNIFLDGIKDSSTIAISVGYGDDKTEEYEYVNFTSMLNVINPYVVDGNTDICNVTNARRRNDAYLEKLSTFKTEDRLKVKDLKKQIDAIDKQMIGLEFDE